MNSIETFEYSGKIINIYNDEDPMNPRTDWDNDDIFALIHRNYSLPFECDKYSFNNFEELKNQIERNNDVAEILPVYMYDHSGVSLSTTPFSCPWDSGQIGWIFITKENARKSHIVKKLSKKTMEIIHNNLLASVKTYSEYLGGEVYGYIISDKDGNDIDSCCGFFGLDYCKEEAKAIVDHMENKIEA